MIALVITIIVLLILASVSIATLTGENGILTQAKNAKEKTEIANIIEMAQIDILGVQSNNNGDITKEELDKILAQYGIVSGEGEDQILTTDKGYIIKVSDIWNGKTSDAENLVKDILQTDSTASETEHKSPYIKYNGLDCRVLYNDDIHGLQIITSGGVEPVSLGSEDSQVTASDFTYNGTATVNDDFLKAAASYNNVVNNLNKKAKTYMDTEGIATDARCLGSIPTLTSDSKFQSETTSEMWYSDSYTYLTTYSWNNKFKTTDTNYLQDVNQINALGLHTTSSTYTNTWLVSRAVGTLSINSTTGFLVPSVDRVGEVGFHALCQVNSDGTVKSHNVKEGFRPIFLLSSNVIISDGDGSRENPYVIDMIKN